MWGLLKHFTMSILVVPGQLSLPRASCTMDFLDELYQGLWSQRHRAFLQLLAEPSFYQKPLQLESLRHCSFQKHRSSAFGWMRSGMFHSLCFPELEKKGSFSQAQMNHQWFKCILQQKSTTWVAPLNSANIQDCKIQGGFLMEFVSEVS